MRRVGVIRLVRQRLALLGKGLELRERHDADGVEGFGQRGGALVDGLDGFDLGAQLQRPRSELENAVALVGRLGCEHRRRLCCGRWR